MCSVVEALDEFEPMTIETPLGSERAIPEKRYSVRCCSLDALIGSMYETIEHTARKAAYHHQRQHGGHTDVEHVQTETA